MSFKQAPDVHWTVSIHALSNGNAKPKLIVFTHSSDATEQSKQYSNLLDLSNDYPENSDVYPVAEAAFEADNFTGPLEVVEVPNTAVAVPFNVTVKPVPGGADYSASLMPGIVYGASQHLYDGAYYAVVANDVKDDEVTELADYLYQQQRVLLVSEVKDVDSLKTNYTDAQTTQLKKNTLGNWVNIVNSIPDIYPAAQVAAYAAANVPTDLISVGNQSEFEVDEALDNSDYETIEDFNGSTIVDKSDDFMMLTGKTLAGNYADQFVHVQMAVDAFTDALQKYKNRQNFPIYDDTTIGEMEKTLEATSTQLVQQSILAGEAKVTSVPRANVQDSDVASREYNYFSINLQVADAIETLNGKIDITL